MLITTFRLDLDAIGLGQTLRTLPDLEVEAERIAAHSTKWTMPCLWAANADFAAVDEALQADPSIDEIVETERFDDEKYYQVEWTDEVEDRIDTYVDKEGSIISARASNEGWEVRIRFASREQFDAFREHVREQGASFDLLDLTEPGSARQSTVSLTPSQRDALVAALERGYYDVPRETAARELAEELDMAHQSLSELLRRGTATLIDSTLTTHRERDG